MKLKTLTELKNSFDVLSFNETKQITGGLMMNSLVDGGTYEIDLINLPGQITSYPGDVDPNSFGVSFSYVYNGQTIEIEDGTYNEGRFTLLYVAPDPMDGVSLSAFSTRVYFDNLTGASFFATGAEKSVLSTADGYEFEDLPDVDVYDDLGGLTRMHFRLETFILKDQITGTLTDYSGIRETGNEYFSGVRAPSLYPDGYDDGSVKRPQSASTSSGNIMDYMNGSKLYAAQKAWKANPASQYQQFNFGNYARNEPQGTPPPNYALLTVEDNNGSTTTYLKDFYWWLRAEIQLNGLKNIDSSFYDGW